MSSCPSWIITLPSANIVVQKSTDPIAKSRFQHTCRNTPREASHLGPFGDLGTGGNSKIWPTKDTKKTKVDDEKAQVGLRVLGGSLLLPVNDYKKCPIPMTIGQAFQPANPTELLANAINSPCRLFLFSDGVYEIYDPAGEAVWTYTQFEEFVRNNSMEQAALLEDLLKHVREIQQTDTLDDDFSILEVAIEANALSKT